MADFRELPGLPAYGPLPMQFSRTGQGMHREGFVVEFWPDSDERWIGNFQPGYCSYSAVVRHPDGRRLLVVAGGEVYMVDPRARTVDESFGGAVEFLVLVPGLGIVVLGNGVHIELIRADGSRCRTRRISWDGMEQIRVEGSRLFGQAYDPLVDSLVPFEVDLLDASHTGGSYPRELG